MALGPRLHGPPGELPHMQAFDMQACMFGSTRPKWTRFLSNSSRMSSLCQVCDGRHVHADWGVEGSAALGQWVFRSASEAEYPLELCRAVSDAVCLTAVDHGHPQYSILHQRDLFEAPLTKKQRIGSNR